MTVITPQELTGQVADKYDRPDIDDKLYLQFASVLREAHSVELYTKDAADQYVPNPFISSNKTTISTSSLPKSIRRILSISSYNSFTGTGIEVDPYIVGTVQQDNFKDISVGFDKTDYFGFKYDQTYAQLGSNITVNGVNQDTTMLVVTALTWPSWEKDIITDEWITDSWIMLEWPGLVEAILSVRACQIMQNTEAMATARTLLAAQRQEFITAFAEYSLCL